MKCFIILALIFLSRLSISNAQNTALCTSADPFCSGVVYNFPMNINTSSELGPNYACLCSQPNPIWYFARIGQSGDITINIQSPIGNDVDFVCWGPYSNPVFPCLNQLTSACTGCASGGCPNNTSNPTFYPSGNVVDCSYDPSYNETVHINNTIAGEYYMLVITNYSNQPGDITFSQVNLGLPGAGTTDCSFIQNHYLDGTVYWDVNENNIKDATEQGIQGAIVYINGCFGAMTQNDGSYTLYTCDTNDVILISLPSSFLVNTVIPYQYQISSSQSVYDFAVTLLPNPELSVNLAHYGPVTVNSNSYYLIDIDNMGGDFATGTYQLLLDSGLTFLSSSISYTSVSGNLYEWVFTDLPPLGSLGNTINVISDSMLANHTILTSSAYVQTGSVESFYTNNADTTSYEVLVSYDPNYIESCPKDTLNQAFVSNSEFIEYTIHFQNTGSAPANRVRILNQLSQNLIKTSFEILESSHPYSMIYNQNGSLEFLFNDINLPDSSASEAGSHGFVKYRIRCTPNLQSGEHIYNTADIYFDFNLPVITNTNDNLLYDGHVRVSATERNKILIYPVPSGDYVNVLYPDVSSGYILEVCTPGGTTVTKSFYTTAKAVINVTGYEKGLYIIKINDGEKIMYGKVVVN